MKEYIYKPKWSNGRLLPPEYKKDEFIDFDPENMWHLQATLDDQPVKADNKKMKNKAKQVTGFMCTFEAGLCDDWLD